MKTRFQRHYDIIRKLKDAGSTEKADLWKLVTARKPSLDNKHGIWQFSAVSSFVSGSGCLFEDEPFEQGTLLVNSRGQQYLTWMEHLLAQENEQVAETLTSMFGELMTDPLVPEDWKQRLFLAQYIHDNGPLNTDFIDYDRLCKENSFTFRTAPFELEKTGTVIRQIQERTLEDGRTKQDHMLSVSDEALEALRKSLALPAPLAALEAQYPDMTPLELSEAEWCQAAGRERPRLEWRFQAYALGFREALGPGFPHDDSGI